MDLNMPVMDGFQATGEIRKYAKSEGLAIRVVGTTADEID